MFHKTKVIVMIMIAFMSPCLVISSKGPISIGSRGCPPCPNPSAKFCNMCANTGIVGNLVVQNSVTLCEGVELPCFCVFDAGLTWGPAEMLPQAAAVEIELLAPVGDTEFQINPDAFQPYAGSEITLRGWRMCSPTDSTCTPNNLMTVQFVVPYDMDINAFSSLFIHFLIPGLVGQSWLRFQVDIELLGFGEDTGASSKLTLLSDNVEVFAPLGEDTLRAYQVQVPLDGLVAPLLANGQFAAITVSRILNDEDPQDEASSVYLSALGFNYRKKQAPLI